MNRVSSVSIAERPLRILVVDDDPLHRAMAEDWLVQAGNRVYFACDGSEALKLIPDRSFDLFLVDLDMPLVDGFEVLRHLRRHPRHATTPVVIATGRNDTAAIDLAYELGATSFVMKPLVWPILMRQLKYVFNAERMKRGLTALHTAMA